MKRTYREIFSSTLGWIIYFTGYLFLSIVTITLVQYFKEGLDFKLALPVFIKWEFMIIIFSFSLANVIYFWQNFIQKFIIFGGLLRVVIIVTLSYLITSALYPYVIFPIKFAYVMVNEIESPLAFIMIILIIFRIYPQHYYDNPQGPVLALPVQKKSQSIPFGMFHPGIDFIQEWREPVYAADDGKIVVAWPYSIYGNMVKINHKNSWSTVYGHLDKITVKYGQEVKKGDLIGYTGSTGYAFNPHLHFEVRFKNKAVDPEKYIKDLKTKKFGKRKNEKS